METSKISPNVMNYSEPRGALSFNPINDAGVMTGEIDIGDCKSFDLTNGIAYKEHMTSHDSVVVLDAKKPSEQKWTGKFTPDERSAENMALFFLADPDANKKGGKYQPAGHQVKKTGYKVYLDRWLDLGKKYIKPNSVILYKASSPNAPCYLSDFKDINGNVAYRIDYENGLIMILSIEVNVSFTDGEAVLASFHYGKVTLKDFTTRIRPMVGFLRYRGLSEQGPRHSFECWKVQITPDAPLNLIKPTDYAGLGYSMDVYYDDDARSHVGAGLPPFFRVTELDNSAVYPS